MRLDEGQKRDISTLNLQSAGFDGILRSRESDPRNRELFELSSCIELDPSPIRGGLTDQPGSMPLALITASAAGAARNLMNALAASASLLVADTAAEK